MAAKSTKTVKADKAEWRPWEAEADEEQIALSRHAEFRAMLARTAEAMKRDGGMTLGELHQSLALMPEDEAEGERLLAELERQAAEEEAARVPVRRRRGAAGRTDKAARKAPTRGS